MPVLIMMNKPYNDEDALATLVNYVCRMGYGYCGGYGVDVHNAAQQMQLVKDLWGKNRGRRVRHFILSFGPSEHIGYERAMKLGFDICRYYRDYQSVYGLHEDTAHQHLHFAVNTVSFETGKMYSEGVSDWHCLRGYIQGLLPKWYVDFKISEGLRYAHSIFERVCI